MNLVSSLQSESHISSLLSQDGNPSRWGPEGKLGIFLCDPVGQREVQELEHVKSTLRRRGRVWRIVVLVLIWIVLCWAFERVWKTFNVGKLCKSFLRVGAQGLTGETYPDWMPKDGVLFTNQFWTLKQICHIPLLLLWVNRHERKAAFRS
jgi:hypothetical protein